MTIEAKHMTGKPGSMLAITYEGRKPLSFSSEVSGASFRSQQPGEIVKTHSYKLIVNYDPKKPDDPHRLLFERTYDLYRAVFTAVRTFKYVKPKEKEKTPVAKLKLAPKTLPPTLEEFIDGGSESLLDTMRDVFRCPIQFEKKDGVTDYRKLSMWIPIHAIGTRTNAFTVSPAARNTAGLDDKDGKLVYVIDPKKRIAWETLHNHVLTGKFTFGGNLIFDAASVSWRFECQSGLIVDDEEREAQSIEVEVTDEEMDEYAARLTPEQREKMRARLEKQNQSLPPPVTTPVKEPEKEVDGVMEGELDDLDLDDDMANLLNDAGDAE